MIVIEVQAVHLNQSNIEVNQEGWDNAKCNTVFFNLTSFYVLTDNRKFISCDQQDEIPKLFPGCI